MKYFTILLASMLWTSLLSAQETLQEPAFLGIESNAISKEKAQALGFSNPFGSYVSKVLPNTAAEQAGIHPLDYIFGIDGIETAEEQKLSALLRKYKAGDRAKLLLYSKGKAVNTTVTFGSRSEVQRRPSSPKAFLGINRHPDNDEAAVGVRIYALENSTASEMNLQDGDLITAINGSPVVDWDDITIAISCLSPGDKIAIAYERDNKKRKATQTIKGRSDQQSRVNTYYTPRETAFLGIYSEQLSKEKARKLGFDNLYGSYVTRVVEKSAAERAGVQSFDYIFGIDEYRTGKEQNLTQVIRKYEPGQDATLQLYRKGKTRTLPVTFGNRTESEAREKDKCKDPFFGITAAKTREDAPDGITVHIIENSTAEALGMEDGDHIVAINDYRMLDWQDIKTAINAMEVGKKITVEFLREGLKQKESGPIKSYCETKPHEAMDIEIKAAPQPGEWFNDYFKKGKEETITIRRIDDIEIDIQSLNASEATKINREKEIALKAANNLAIEDLSIEQDDDNYEMEFTLPGNGKTTLRIYNEAGRLIYQYDLGNFSGDFRDEVNLSQNGDGQFYLEIQQGNKSVTKKITLSSK